MLLIKMLLFFFASSLISMEDALFILMNTVYNISLKFKMAHLQT